MINGVNSEDVEIIAEDFLKERLINCGGERDLRCEPQRK
jgi:hypothetical protein